MEKKGLRKRDILRIDGLLPPTRRLPVCNAVSSTSDKKKDKKWSIGGILRRISSMRDYDSSSNDEEIVYCKKTPRRLAKSDNRPNGIVLHSVENDLEQDRRIKIENNVSHTTDTRRDSLHSRGSDGSLDGLGKKVRKNQLKARAEAKRDHLCANSSSDEDCRRSNSSLNRFHGADGAYNGQKSNACNRKTRAARTERYIKRMSKDEGNSSDALNDPHHKRCSSEYIEEEQQRAFYTDVNGSCRPPVYPRRAFGVFSSNHAFPVQGSSAENLRDTERAALPGSEINNPNDFRRYSIGNYVTDLNQNNYGKITRDVSRDAYVDTRQAGNFFTYPAKNVCHYMEPFEHTVDRWSINPENNRPPEPPPRDPRYRVFNYGYNSYPANRYQSVPSSYEREDTKTSATNGLSKPDWRYFRSYGSSNQISRHDTVERDPKNSITKSNPTTEFRNSLECINNRYNSTRHRANDANYEETEAMRCRRRNTRNNQLNRNDDTNYSTYATGNQSTNICELNKREATSSSVASSEWPSSRSPCKPRPVTPTMRDIDKCIERSSKEDNRVVTPGEERRRSSKNLEEALCELEAIYNSLRLGDEDLLDRAERRSMEEFSLKRDKSELDAMVATVTPDSPDRTKDDMAYRRMHPKERPTSLSDVAGQSTLSHISYLIASPVLARRDSTDDLGIATGCHSSCRDEPDVTRDDVVFRSISRANNTLKVIDPQPPFGIPLGPVTGATESDYLHTTPTKPEQPRSPYIPQCMPDIVTDDLAYRTLRKDIGAVRNTMDSKMTDMSREPIGICGAKKKRAIRSMSANLYGLINQDRIHLRREPSLDAIGDEMHNVTRNSITTITAERPEYLRRVMSDSELSDKDAHRRRESVRAADIDINGNHPTVNAYQRKLSNVYVSLESPVTTATTRESPKKEKESNVATLSDAVLSSKSTSENEFWHEYLRSDSKASDAANSLSTEADFTAYSRLCQDLVNLIRDGGENDDIAIESLNASSCVASPDKSSDLDVTLQINESPTSRCAHSPEDYHSRSRREEVEDENAKSLNAFPINSISSELGPSKPAKSLDFYLRVADENVKLIAAAFGSVADHLRDSRHISTCKSSPTNAHHDSEIETQSSSARSSTLYSQNVASKRSSLASNEEDQCGNANHNNEEKVLTADIELDLSQAVRDLQLAAASLCEHGQEIEDLGVGCDKWIDTCRDATPATAISVADKDDVDSPIRKISLIAAALKERECKEEEEEGAFIHDATPITAPDAREDKDKSPACKISYSIDVSRQEQEPEHEEEKEEKEEKKEEEKQTTMTILPSEIAEERKSDCVENREGERTVCELARKSCRRTEDAQSDGTLCAFSCVTNLITTRITMYYVLLLACLLALLLAIVAAAAS